MNKKMYEIMKNSEFLLEEYGGRINNVSNRKSRKCFQQAGSFVRVFNQDLYNHLVYDFSSRLLNLPFGFKVAKRKKARKLP